MMIREPEPNMPPGLWNYWIWKRTQRRKERRRAYFRSQILAEKFAYSILRMRGYRGGTVTVLVVRDDNKEPMGHIVLWWESKR